MLTARKVFGYSKAHKHGVSSPPAGIVENPMRKRAACKNVRRSTQAHVLVPATRLLKLVCALCGVLCTTVHSQSHVKQRQAHFELTKSRKTTAQLQLNYFFVVTGPLVGVFAGTLAAAFAFLPRLAVVLGVATGFAFGFGSWSSSDLRFLPRAWPQQWNNTTEQPSAQIGARHEGQVKIRTPLSYSMLKNTCQRSHVAPYLGNNLGTLFAALPHCLHHNLLGTGKVPNKRGMV